MYCTTKWAVCKILNAKSGIDWKVTKIKICRPFCHFLSFRHLSTLEILNFPTLPNVFPEECLPDHATFHFRAVRYQIVVADQLASRVVIQRKSDDYRAHNNCGVRCYIWPPSILVPVGAIFRNRDDSDQTKKVFKEFCENSYTCLLFESERVVFWTSMSNCCDVTRSWACSDGLLLESTWNVVCDSSCGSFSTLTRSCTSGL